MIVKIFINPTNYNLDTLYKKDDDEYLIGVERGAYYALKKGLKLDLVLGDFDSVTKEEKKFIDQNSDKVHTHNSRKDETDSYLAIKEAIKLMPEEIVVYGGIGNRIDHTFANIMLLKQGNITFLNDMQKMTLLAPGSYEIMNNYEYISFFAIEDVKRLTLKGFSFELDNYDLYIDDPLCVSNQGSGEISFKNGLVLVLQAND